MTSKHAVHFTAMFLVAVPALGQGASTKDPQEKFYQLGHSAHVTAFDVGPRQKPWRMEGIGQSHFPITSSNLGGEAELSIGSGESAASYRATGEEVLASLAPSSKGLMDQDANRFALP